MFHYNIIYLAFGSTFTVATVLGFPSSMPVTAILCIQHMQIFRKQFNEIH